MDYLLHGNAVALGNLGVFFRRACQAVGVQIGQTTATRILMQLLEEAKERGLLEEVPEASEGHEEGSDET